MIQPYCAQKWMPISCFRVALPQTANHTKFTQIFHTVTQFSNRQTVWNITDMRHGEESCLAFSIQNTLVNDIRAASANTQNYTVVTVKKLARKRWPTSLFDWAESNFWLVWFWQNANFGISITDRIGLFKLITWLSILNLNRIKKKSQERKWRKDGIGPL